MRTLFISTVVFIAFLAGVFYYVCYTPAMILKAIPPVAEKYFKDAQLVSLEIAGQSFLYPETLKLYNISLEAQWQKEHYQITIHELDILNFTTFARNKQQLICHAAGVNIRQKNGQIKDSVLDLTLNLDGDSWLNFKGTVLDGNMEMNPYQLSKVKIQFEGNHDGYTVPEFMAGAYGGLVKGQLKIENRPHRTQEISLEYTGLRGRELQNINQPLFSQLSGEFNGKFRLTRLDDQLQLLAIYAEVPKGGVLDASLGKRIVGYMTDEESRYRLETMIADNHTIPFDSAEFRVLNINPKLAGVTVTLINKKENVKIHETINIDIARILQKISWNH